MIEARCQRWLVLVFDLCRVVNGFLLTISIWTQASNIVDKPHLRTTHAHKGFNWPCDHIQYLYAYCLRDAVHSLELVSAQN